MDRLLSTLLTRLDGVTDQSAGDAGRVLVVGATSTPEVLDPALVRPGRLFHQVAVDVLDAKVATTAPSLPLSYNAHPGCTPLFTFGASGQNGVYASLAARSAVARHSR